MKKLISLILCMFFLTGCFKRDTMEDINIYTTTYPIEYITERLYGDNSNIFSIYPDGIIVDNYELTDKQVKEYSDSSLFIFNGYSSKESNYVVEFFEYNKNLKIINTTDTMKYTYEIEELWLDPSNFLMISQNIRNGLKEYITNHYLRTSIDDEYEQLKIEISQLESKLKSMIEESNDKVIVVSNNVFNYLIKYDIDVISLDSKNEVTERTINRVISLINDGTIKYIFVPQHEELSDAIKKITEQTDVEIIYFHTLDNITETERNDKKDYISIMNDNIELLREELYN